MWRWLASGGCRLHRSSRDFLARFQIRTGRALSRKMLLRFWLGHVLLDAQRTAQTAHSACWCGVLVPTNRRRRLIRKCHRISSSEAEVLSSPTLSYPSVLPHHLKLATDSNSKDDFEYYPVSGEALTHHFGFPREYKRFSSIPCFFHL